MQLLVEPHKHQRDGSLFLLNRPRGAGLLCYGTGTGKTLIQIIAGMVDLKKGRIDRFLFFGTVSSLIEIAGDFSKLTDETPVTVKTVSELRAFMDGESRFALIQYNWWTEWVYPRKNSAAAKDGRSPMDRTVEVETELRRARIGVTLDEFHVIKNPESNVRKTFDAFRHLYTTCYGATATPVMATIYDLFHLLRFLDFRVLGSLYEFEEKYVHKAPNFMLPRTHTNEPQETAVCFKNLAHLRAKVDTLVHNYFPPYDINYTKKTRELGPEAWSRYLAAANGVLEAEDTGDKNHSARLVDLQKVVNQSDEKKSRFRELTKRWVKGGLIVFAAFYDTLDVIAEILDAEGIEWKSITGRKTAKKRWETKEWFVADPENKVLIITKAGGQSLNLQATNRILFYDIPYGIGAFVQTMGRVVRRFSDFDSFEIVFLCIKSTIDEYKYELIASQKELIGEMFDNRMLPASDKGTGSWDARIIRMLRKELLWCYGV